MKCLCRKRIFTAFIALISTLGNLSIADPGPNQNYIGINIGTTQDWDGTLIFADAMKQARQWELNGTSLSSSQVDAQGWPKVGANIIVWAGLVRDNSGTYALSFVSDTPVSVSPTVENLVRNAATGVTTAQLVLTGPSQDLFMSFSGAVRDVKLMRPIAPGSNTSHATAEDFSRPFLRAIAPFHVLRFMDYLATYGNPSVNWSDRVQPDSSSFNLLDPRYSWEGKGGAFEYIIKLCNQTKKDAWICVPLTANDDYIHQLAKLFRDGNTFSGNIGLDPSLKLYVEYGNEVWNTAGAFDGLRNHDLAIAEQKAGDLFHYNFDGANNDWFWAWRRIGRRALDISMIFRQEFGDARMMSQIRPVFEWQLGFSFTGHDPLKYLEAAYIPSVAPNKPINYFFYAGGGSAYYAPDRASPLNISNFWQSGHMDPTLFGTAALMSDMQVSATFGLKRAAYEGGPSLDTTGNSAIDSVQAQAWADARMANEMTEHQTEWSQWGGDMLIYFSLVPNDYQWGFSKSIDDLTLPKYVATAALATSPRAATTHFHPIPSTLQGNEFDINFFPWEVGSGIPGNNDIPANQWSSYIFNATADLTAGISASYSGGAGGRLSLVVDGVEASVKTATGTGTITATVNWTKGIHSARLQSTGAGVTINNVSVAASGSIPNPDSTPPTVPTALNALVTSSNAVTLTWNASTDNVAVTGYNIFRGSSLVGTTTTTSFSDTGLAAGATVTYSVSARDAAGNNSAQSASATVTTTPAPPADTQVPTTPSGLVSSNVTSSAVTVTWSASSDNVGVAGYNVFRNGTKLNTSLMTGTSFAVSGLAPSTSYSFTVQAADAAGNLSALSLPLSVLTSSTTFGLPAPWLSQDIGATSIAGSVAALGDAFSITASGSDIWASADAFRYVYQSLGNSGQITVRLATQTNSDPWAKAGIMIRQTLEAGSPYINFSVTPSNGITLQRRRTLGGSSDMPLNVAGGAPTWLRLRRNGNTFIASSSIDGTTWKQLGTTTCTMTSTVFVGLSVTAHNATATSTASFENVSVATTTPPPPVPNPLPPPGGTQVLDFSASAVGVLPNPYNDPSGYTLTGSFDLPNSTAPDPLQITTIGTNKVLMNSNWSSKISLKKTDGTPFSLTLFRFASDPWNGLADAVVTGITATGATLVTHYTATSTSLQTLTLNWTNLTNVTIQFSGGANDSYGMVDDFTVSP